MYRWLSMYQDDYSSHYKFDKFKHQKMEDGTIQISIPIDRQIKRKSYREDLRLDLSLLFQVIYREHFPMNCSLKAATSCITEFMKNSADAKATTLTMTVSKTIHSDCIVKITDDGIGLDYSKAFTNFERIGDGFKYKDLRDGGLTSAAFESEKLGSKSQAGGANLGLYIAALIVQASDKGMMFMRNVLDETGKITGAELTFVSDDKRALYGFDQVIEQDLKSGSPLTPDSIESTMSQTSSFSSGRDHSP